MFSQDWIEPLIKIAVVVGGMQGAVAYLVLAERRAAAFFQDRVGPNRVGPFGLLQPLADGLKFILKEELVPAGAHKPVFLLAPVVILAAATLAFASVPMGYYLPAWFGAKAPIELTIAPNLDIGLLFVLAISSLGVYGVILGGWASNSKYSFLGGLRSSAQLISYELPLGLSLIGAILLTGSLRMETIMNAQATSGWWWIMLQPLGFIVFLISGFAEASRLPFDLPECEQELVGGYHTEYTAMKFGMFAMAEYMHMITVAFLAVIIYFGGWHLWFIAPYVPAEEIGIIGGLIRIGILQVKVLAMVFFFMWVRWSFPRFRYDQLMSIGWKIMIPLGLVNLLVSAVAQEFLAPDAYAVKAVISWVVMAGCFAYGILKVNPQGAASAHALAKS
jgi:NADH-quinone oxidoreductase subunit H